jgi:hypothetical protein
MQLRDERCACSSHSEVLLWHNRPKMVGEGSFHGLELVLTANRDTRWKRQLQWVDSSSASWRSQLFTMQATGTRQPWWLNESLKKWMMEGSLLLFHVFCSTISVETNHGQSRHSSSTCVGLVGCFTPNVETRRLQMSTGLSQTCLLPIRLSSSFF